MLALLAVAGCSQANSTRLPELASLPRRLLSDEEQKKAVEELKARQETHRAQAVKEIEQARSRQGGELASDSAQNPLGRQDAGR
jgi:hypothetical protein